MYESKIPQVIKELERAEERALTQVGIHVTAKTVSNVQRLNIIDTGRLMGSYGYDVDGKEVQIGTNVEYAPDHEFGINVSARPHLRPAFDKKEIEAIVAKELGSVAQ